MTRSYAVFARSFSELLGVDVYPVLGFDTNGGALRIASEGRINGPGGTA
jgi:hypothetical protein